MRRSAPYRVANLAQDRELVADDGRRRRLLPLQPIDLSNHHENDEREDQEVDRDSEEIAVGKQRHAGFGERLVGHRTAVAGWRAGEHHEVAREVEATEDSADDRHDDVLDKRIDDLAERGTDDDADRKVDHVALDRELAKLLRKTHGPRPPVGSWKRLPSPGQRCEAVSRAFHALRPVDTSARIPG